jgi:thiosulfate/3-mercaptopyruvate sulfurtransferase
MPNARERYFTSTAKLPYDIDEIAGTSRDLPHMLPDPLSFSQAMQRLGLGDGMRVVAYDGARLLSAARVWWTPRLRRR